HELVWTDHAAAVGRYPEGRVHHQVLKAHVQITEAIAAGNAPAAARRARRHLDESQAYLLAQAPDARVNVLALRAPLSRY
ncbi:MAG: GntR family transcriptional regulator, partial [Actinomycetia bacterium]|nr:GntR family transcriptional regulator [Actinomycetes bacterium]